MENNQIHSKHNEKNAKEIQPESLTSSHGRDQKSKPQQPVAEGEKDYPYASTEYARLSQFIGWCRAKWFDPYRKRASIAEMVTGCLTLAITVIMLLQYYVYRQQKRIMESSGHQTDQLITAANIQASAANRFSDAACGIKNASEIAAHALASQVQKLQAGVDQTQRLAKAAEGANRQAVQTLQAQTRPWITIEDVAPEFVWVLYRRARIDFSIHNYGQSPAVHVSFAFEVKHEPTIGYSVKFFKSVCDKSDSAFSRGELFGPTMAVFPGTPGVVRVENHTAPIVNEGDLVGCISYTDSKGGRPYHTRIAYGARWIDAPNARGFPDHTIKTFDLRASYTSVE